MAKQKPNCVIVPAIGLDENPKWQELAHLTLPAIKEYANKCDADLILLTKRAFDPAAPIYLEKFQTLNAWKNGYQWALTVDLDACINWRDMPVVWSAISKSVVFNFGRDFAPVRFRFPGEHARYYERCSSGSKGFGCCTWFVAASELTGPDLWEFPTYWPDFISNHSKYVNLSQTEYNCGLAEKGQCLLDDYSLSVSVHKYGLDICSMRDIIQKIPWLASGPPLAVHSHLLPIQRKIDLAKIFFGHLEGKYPVELLNQCGDHRQPWPPQQVEKKEKGLWYK